MIKHATPGPWTYDRNTSEVYGGKRYGKISETALGSDFEGCMCNNLNKICEVRDLLVYDVSRIDPATGEYVKYFAREDVKQRVKDRGDANVRLIVCAPEMYVFLKQISTEPWCMSDLENLLKKVEGVND